MKKYLVAFLVILVMLTMFVGTVGAAPKMSVTFLEGIWTGYGVNFKFKVSENLGSGWLTATVSWDGGKVDMTCVQEDDIVTCTGPKIVADKNIVVSFQGMSFSTYVRSHPFCYGVYDWPVDGSTAWFNYGSYCQEVPANYGDSIIWANPVLGVWPYEFLSESPVPCDFDPVYGDAYYYPSCPGSPE